MTNTLKIKIEIPQETKDSWKVATALMGKPARFSKKKTSVSAYRFVESRIKRFLGTSHDHKTVVWVQDGQYHNDGEYTDVNTALYALTCFLEDYLTLAFKNNRIKKYYTGL